ncbi:acyltransferase family protein [Simiduia curdlanivorans]|uniref:Acyltransferase family protein n=1 Tax=Simiduia curdlanivorans TaxID=1492769 RepID=A0ABV8V5Y3_9GAMM|nr:acyltransferase family protein [Simiduia curdlanivorans]MDN3638632.1 acyltransferase family protein [Simiduia curdlanivorans]
MQRRYDLDWLRVIAFSLLILYHTGMMYVSWDWHITSAYQSESLKWLMQWVNPWRLSLLFFISGCALYFALQRYRSGVLLRLRTERLLIPLVFGILVIVPPQLFFEMRQAGESTGNYWQFWLAYLTPDHPLFSQHRTPLFGQMTWNHLWFIPYLWCYSVLMLLAQRLVAPLIRGLRYLTLPTLVLLPAGLLTLYGMVLKPYYPESHALFNDWYNHALYFTVFLLGYIFAGSDHVWQQLKNKQVPLLALAFCCYGLLMWARSLPDDLVLSPAEEFWGGHVFLGIELLNIWCWILALCSLAQRYANHNSRVLKYANTAVYPYYILHQTLTVSFGYGIVALNLKPWLEPTSIVVLTFLGCILGYEIIRRQRTLRWLFGLAPLPTSAPKIPNQVLSGSA